MVRLVLALFTASLAIAQPPAWRTVETDSNPTARHECALVAAGGKLYLIGGRGIKPVEIYNPATNEWTTGAQTPIEIHHFQPVVFDGKIYVVGALTGPYPHETPVPSVLIYDPATDVWTEGPSVPVDRRRGAAGVAVRDGKIYVVSGIVDGHWAGHVPWLDEFDPKSGAWKPLPDAPRARDHFQAVAIGGRIYAAGGRRSSAKTKEVFQLTVGEVDIFDFATGKWTTAPRSLPTQRAGNSAIVVGSRLVVLGGETGQEQAHAEVEALNTASGDWETLPALVRGRHGTGAAILDGWLYTAAGSGNRGGGPELNTLEALPLAEVWK